MNSKNLGQTIAVAVAIIVAIYASISILLNPTGGIAGLSKLVAILGIILGIMNPKAGLFFLVVQAVYADEIKRIGVYYGVQSSQTVSEILIGPLLTLCAINVSFLHGVLTRRFKLGGLGWMLYMIAPTAGAVILFKSGDWNQALNLYLAATASLYITLVPICYGIFNTHEEWARFVGWQVIVASPAAAWAIWQYFHGFNDIEWSYALSGLSRVHTLQMMMDEPRVFGMFGSASAMGCIGIYGPFALWHALRFRKLRFLFLFLAAIYAGTIICSHQRTTLLYPVIIWIFALAFRRISTTAVLYAGVAAVFVIGVLNSGYLLDKGLGEINDAIAGEGRWTENVMSVSTFSDRLRGWERLTRASSWSLFGTGSVLRSSMEAENHQDYTADDYSHDLINRILINFGAVGLFAVLAVASFITLKLHSVIFRSNDPQLRRDGAFIMACIIPLLILAFMGGDNFTATPINLQTWSVFSGIFLMKKLADEKRRMPSPHSGLDSSPPQPFGAPGRSRPYAPVS